MSKESRLRVTLAELDERVVRALQAEVAHAGLDDVAVRSASVFEVGATAIATPTNSFGFMDGGLDLQITLRLGTSVQDRLRQRIAAGFGGELLVGQAVAIPIADAAQITHVIAAPTMRVPMRLGPDTVNPYLAMRAVLRAAATLPTEHGPTHLAVPGLGTGTGRVPPDVAAHQMVTAILDTRSGRPMPATWDEAVAAHRHLSDSRTAAPT